MKTEGSMMSIVQAYIGSRHVCLLPPPWSWIFCGKFCRC